MSIDWTVFNGLSCALPKGRVKALVVEDARAKLETQDKTENAKAKARAEGRCEVRVGKMMTFVRCQRAGVDPHHLIGGSGRRNRGKSILAQYKLWVCRQCHDDITAKKLQPTTATHDAQSVRYRRAK